MKLLLGQLLMIASVVHSQSSCPEPEELGCLVCGEGKCISENKADAIFSYGDFGEGSCADIQALGLIGTGDNADLACQFLPVIPDFQTQCGCECRDVSCLPPTDQRTTLPQPVTPAPTPAPTPATTAATAPDPTPAPTPDPTPDPTSVPETRNPESAAPASEAPVAPTSNAFQASRSSIALVFGAFVVAGFY
eukprot:CAMPEP_0178916502 /NCGR_PEP_ID=MMETSP0786-20121207/12684_1 /TAXON_ID=186022 /ORGANISM="Thalassionema frauenfeldii, Strain CCMP 1798" /LENGTH=191 /DNA_ID=CAMNT_0020589863 /DNA_START=98 /DNA_END=673 /DNA_ORIENTATION=+